MRKVRDRLNIGDNALIFNSLGNNQPTENGGSSNNGTQNINPRVKPQFLLYKLMFNFIY